MRREVVIGLAGVVVGLVIGWIAKPSTQCVDQPIQTPAPTDNARRMLQQLVTRLHAKDAATTAQSMRLLAANKAYQDSMAVLRKQQRMDSDRWATAETLRDSAAACSIVVLDCERRASLAERRVDELQAQLGKQTQLQSRRFGLMVMGPHARLGGGSLIGWEPAVAVGFGWRIF